MPVGGIRKYFSQKPSLQVVLGIPLREAILNFLFTIYLLNLLQQLTLKRGILKSRLCLSRSSQTLAGRLHSINWSIQKMLPVG